MLDSITALEREIFLVNEFNLNKISMIENLLLPKYAIKNKGDSQYC